MIDLLNGGMIKSGLALDESFFEITYVCSITFSHIFILETQRVSYEIQCMDTIVCVENKVSLSCILKPNFYVAGGFLQYYCDT